MTNLTNSSPKRRHSRQRQAVYEAVQASDCHPTADDVFEIVRRRLPRVSLGTVYRNLEVLAEDGEILRLDATGGQRRYDRTTKNHYHVRCERCGRVDDVGGDERLVDDDSHALDTDYEITGMRVSFTGVCPSCQSETEPI
ncbi:MAG: Fur family transcriptional regulator [Verrucomicrobiota bacterium]